MVLIPNSSTGDNLLSFFLADGVIHHSQMFIVAVKG